MNSKIKTFKEACLLNRSFKKQGKKVVFALGVFDILHHGHVYLLTEAKKLGDILVVGVECDINVKVLKGESRPINKLKSRLFVVSNIVGVDYVFPVPPPTKDKYWRVFI